MPGRHVTVEGEYKFGGVQMTSYIETAKDSISRDETVNIAQETKQYGQGPMGIKGNNKMGP